MSSYAVLWSNPRQKVEAGKLELEPDGVRFEGSHVQWVEYDEIDQVRIGYRVEDRLAGRPAVIVDLAAGGALRIGSVHGVGTVSELADALSRGAGGARRSRARRGARTP